MKLAVVSVELDTSIQCRAAIDTAVVNDYAERMQAGDTFPPIEVFGSRAKSWIGDGWHRVFAARQLGADTIAARVTPGGRVDALKHALGANAIHGNHRTNADKRRAVEIALREFPKLSSRAVAKMCGVSDRFVGALRDESGANGSHVERTGQDGKQYPAKREPQEQTEAGDAMSEKEAAPDAIRNRHLWKSPPSDKAGQVARAIDTIESMTDALAGIDPAGSDVNAASDWSARLRKCRTKVSRFIARCEEVR